MTVENVTYISDLDQNNPAGGDSISEGDDHIRNIKKAIKGTFPNVTGEVTLTTDEFQQLKDSLSNPGIVASCKYNGTQIMYQEGIKDVVVLGTNGYRVEFSSGISGFDAHYAPVVTPFVSGQNTVIVPSLTGFTADYVEFVMTEITNNGVGMPAAPVGFSLLIVDMIRS